MKMEKMMKSISTVLLVALAIVTTGTIAMGGGVKYKNEDGDYVKFGARLQLQYHMEDPKDGESTDSIFFRRLRPYIEGSTHENWKGKWQFDLGKGSVEIKDAFMAYTGIDGMTVMIGNYTMPYSREVITSSKKQQLVERTFVGDHNYGTPERQAGIHLTGKAADTVTWGASVAKAAHDPSNKKLDFDTVASLNKGDDWTEGEMVAARVDLHPMGIVKFEQGDFKGDCKATVGVAAFSYQGDEDDEGEPGENLDTATGYEVSAALRVAGLSVDAEYNSIEAELVDGPAGTDGLYVDGKTTLENYAVEGGFMVLPKTLEIVAGYQSQDADGYAKSWNRTSVGANFFVAKHDIKYQLTYRMGENKDGKDGNDVDELFVQAQYVF
jgi:phosphate-selective porin OprO/OprP